MTIETNNENSINNENSEIKPDDNKLTEADNDKEKSESSAEKDEATVNSEKTTDEKEKKPETKTRSTTEGQTQRQPYNDRRRDYQRSDSSQRYNRFKRKVCRFCTDKNAIINYKDSGLLERFITDRGKILPRRVTGTCARHQRDLARAIKRARIIALIPYVEK